MKGEKLLNSILVILFLAGVGFAGYLILPQPGRPESVPTMSTVQQIEKMQKQAPQPAKQEDVRDVLKKPMQVAPNEKPPEPLKKPDPRQKELSQKTRFPEGLRASHVHFKVIEGGYAVAFGDLIMGKLSEEQQGLREGVFEPTKPSLWPSHEIPYLIDKNLDSTAVKKAIQHFESETPIRFVPLAAEHENGIVFVPSEEHCASLLGMVGGVQPILLSKDCGLTQVLHEIMHALGFVHEHSREDRDQHLQVNWQNIQVPFLPQFNIVPDTLVHNYTGSVFSFDPQSIMLYPEHAFSKDPAKLTTLQSKTREPLRPSQNSLSKIDKERIYYLYGY
jgi:hypothetical protein